MREEERLIVIGGGAAGMMAAITAAQAGAPVLLLERNERPGRKIYITGKGRCNLTNACPPQEVLAHVPGNGKFLTGAMFRTPPEAVMRLFEEMGVPLKTERGNRVFPCSDRAADVIDALTARLRRLRVRVVQDRARRLVTDESGRIARVEGERDTYPCRAAVLATGGASYPRTGSTGDGYEMARQAGHEVIPPRPSLVPLETEERFCAQMQGLSLRNVELKVSNSGGKTVFHERGELLFTHFGVSGPLVLSASACMRQPEERYTALIDLKPALDEAALDDRLVRELAGRANQTIANVLGALVPRSMIPVMIELTEIPTDTKGHEVSRQQRRRLLETMKGLTLHVTGTRPLDEAVVTAGGVSVRQIDPKTMGSKLVPGLFFAGEVMDVDAFTGGFNLQIAWATGVAAGNAAAEYCKVNSLYIR